MKRLLIILAAFMVVGAVAVTTFTVAEHDAASPRGDVHVVERGTIVETAAATGVAQPRVQIELRSRTAGEIVEVLVEEGQRVEAGQLLFRLDSTDAERAVQEAQAGLRRARGLMSEARAHLSIARTERESAITSRTVASQGVQMGLVSSEQSRAATTSEAIARAGVRANRGQVRAVEADVDAAQLAVDEAERRLEQTRIVAPVAGTILSVDVERGSIVSSPLTNVGGGTRLATLADLTDLRVIAQVDQAQVGRVAVGQDADIRIDAFADKTFSGRVALLTPLGTDRSGVITFDVEVLVTDADKERILSGMRADVEIHTSAETDVVIAPLAALESVGRERFVRLENGARRPIVTGPNDGVNIVVREGLAAGDRILIGGAVAPAAEPSGALSQSKRR